MTALAVAAGVTAWRIMARRPEPDQNGLEGTPLTTGGAGNTVTLARSDERAPVEPVRSFRADREDSGARAALAEADGVSQGFPARQVRSGPVSTLARPPASPPHRMSASERRKEEVRSRGSLWSSVIVGRQRMIDLSMRSPRLASSVIPLIIVGRMASNMVSSSSV